MRTAASPDHPRAAFIIAALGAAAGAGLITLLAVAGAFGAHGLSDADLATAYQDGFAVGLEQVAPTNQTTTLPAAMPPPDVRLLQEARSGQLLEVSEDCFQRAGPGCPEIY